MKIMLSLSMLCFSLFCLLCLIQGRDEVTCKAWTTSNGNSTLKLVHKDGPCSPLFNGEPVNHTQLMLDDVARVKWIHSKFSRAGATGSLEDSAVTLGARYGPNGLNYLVTIGLGTPKKDQIVLIDTGSALTWTQCKLSSYDPLQSSSYANITYAERACLLVEEGTGFPSRNDGGTCRYTARYEDDSGSEGFSANETLTLSPTDTIANFMFGCAQEISESLVGLVGLFGLSRAKISFVEQSNTKYGRYFSYCLPASTSSTGYLSFGKGSMRSSLVSFTPMLRGDEDFYQIKITRISLNGRDLDINPSMFSNTPALIDSGTVVTRLPGDMYKALRSAFEQAMSGYRDKKVGPFEILDTCYDLSNSPEFTVPVIRFTFDGPIAVDLDSSGVLYSPKTSQTCLAFAEHKDPNMIIYGSIQQKTFEVVYDVAGGQIGFRANGCS